ncbi:MAG: hypothetical protein WC914_08755 [Proteiniphilum sp.]
MARPPKNETTKTKVDDQVQPVNTKPALTPEQQAIISRVESESADWAPIREDEMHDFSLADHPLDLKKNFPEAWKEQNEQRYAFRFCERTDKRIDELTRSGHPALRWKICTRSTTPFLEKYIDPMWGCITRLDQVLLFRPWDRHMIEMGMKAGYAEAQANSGKPENIAMRRAKDGIEAQSGPEFKIGSTDEVQYEDTRSEGESVDFSDLVVDE